MLYAGIKGKSIPAELQALIRGKSPATAANANTITGAPAGQAVGPGGGSGAIASNAQQVAGHCYKFGGAPGANGAGCWDCSSCASWIIGRMSGLQIPGGDWATATANGSQHGPDTLSYLAWRGAQTVGHHSAAAQPGDLCVWQTHMGICTGPNQMMSAQNPANGTVSSQIDGFMPGEFLFVRRIMVSNG